MDAHQAAPGLLGSTLHAAAKAPTKIVPPPASSGCTGIDEAALGGGFRYGEITSIAGTGGMGKTTLTFHAVASQLLRDDQGEVAIVDTKGSFSPQHLRDILAHRLSQGLRYGGYKQSGYMYERQRLSSGLSYEDSSKQATTLLGRVKVMRVFDLAGLIEAVGEIGDICESAIQEGGSFIKDGLHRRRKSIADSEEEVDEDLEEAASTDGSNTHGAKDDSLRHRRTHKVIIGMIIIDTITNVVAPVMAKSQVQGQALLSGLMRSLRHLTTRHRICTLLTNSMVGVQTSSNLQYRRRPEENVSIFASIIGKPALGKTFAHLVDTSILLSTIPETRRDAERAYGTDSGDPDYSSASVLEVLTDRSGSQAEKWAVFHIKKGMEIRLIQLKPY